MLRKGRTREQASAQFAGEWDEGGAGNAFSTANRRFAPLKMPFLPHMSPKMIKDERAAALSNSPWDFFDSLGAENSPPFLFVSPREGSAGRGAPIKKYGRYCANFA